MSKYKRRIKLIKPRFQNQLTMVFMGMSSLGVLMQFILFHSTVSDMAAGLPSDGARLLEGMNAALLSVLAITLFAILPLTYIVGVLTTFRVAGPVYRVEKHLEAIVRDGYQGPCTIRKGDKLQDLVDVLNEATAAMAQRSSGQDDASLDQQRPAA